MVLELLVTKTLQRSSTSVTTTTTATNESSSDVKGREENAIVEVGRLHLHSSTTKSRVRDRRVKPTTGDFVGRPLHNPREDLWGRKVDLNFNSSFRLRRTDSDSGFKEEKKKRSQAGNGELGLVVGGRFDGYVEKRFSIDGYGRNSSRIRNMELGGEEGVVVRRGFIDKVEPFHLNENDHRKGFQLKTCQCDCCSNGEIKRLGETISKGHRKYQLMQCLQLGIRFSVGKTNSISREISPEDFDPKEKFWTRFPTQGSKTTPGHRLMEFRWKDYCPMVFRQLRELLEVDSADYMLAICENGCLRELSSPGKSGSFFYLTQDDRFMIKTVKKSEVKVLLRMLPGYYKHVYQYRNTLITKFFGVHCIKPIGGLKTRFIVMGNLFSSEYRIHRRFDLKGSSHGRITSKPGEGINENTTLKDLDLNFKFHLKRYWLQKLNRQIARDCKFLESERIMDYSLLVGLHFLECPGNLKRQSSNTVPSGSKNLLQEEVSSCKCHFVGMERKNVKGILSGRKNLIRLGGNMPAKAQYVARGASDKLTSSEGGNSTPNGGDIRRVILHFGIIDILQDYDINKKLEHAYKSLQVDPISISAVDPKLYSSRFRGFIRKVFLEDK